MSRFVVYKKQIQTTIKEYSIVPIDAIETSLELHQQPHFQTHAKDLRPTVRGDSFSEECISDVLSDREVQEGIVDTEVMPG